MESAQKPRHFWGNHPETEEDFYASQNIRSTSSFFFPKKQQKQEEEEEEDDKNLSIFTRSWLPPPHQPTRALIFMLHGYGNDISWTFQATPIFLAQHGFACFALDLPSHGRSSGVPAFLPDLHSVIDDVIIPYFSSILARHPPSLRSFLFGESMGGAICLLVHLRRRLPRLHGAVLVAPMCKISDKIRPPWPLPQILSFVARFVPTLPIVPTADLVEKSVKVEEKRVIAAGNPLRYTGKPRLGTVLELLRVTDELSGRLLSDVTIPFLVLHGSADVVTDPEVSRELKARARSEDKTIKVYEGMMHSLLFGETDDNVELVRRDILDWLNARTDSDPDAANTTTRGSVVVENE